MKLEESPEWVKEIESKPDKMLRVLPLDAKNQNELEGSLAILHRGERLFKNLHDNYGISIPEMQTSIKHNDDGTVEAQIEVDRIIGFEIDKARALPEKVGENLDKFYFSLANHYWDVLINGGDYWFDFRDDQLMYGHKHSGEEDSVYIIDVDPEYQTYDPQTKSQGRRLLRLLGRIAESVLTMESKIQSGLKFKNTRTLLTRIYSEIPRDEPFYDETIKKAKQVLGWEITQAQAA